MSRSRNRNWTGLELLNIVFCPNPAQRMNCFAGNHSFFIGRNYENPDAGAGFGNIRYLATLYMGVAVSIGKSKDTEGIHKLANPKADFRRIFTNSSGKNQHIESPQSSCISTDIFSDPVAEGCNRQFAARIAGISRLYNFPLLLPVIPKRPLFLLSI